MRARFGILLPECLGSAAAALLLLGMAWTAGSVAPWGGLACGSALVLAAVTGGLYAIRDDADEVREYERRAQAAEARLSKCRSCRGGGA